MNTPGPRVWEGLAAAALLVLFVAAAGAALRSDSSVADEHPHILSGWLYWKSGRFAGGLDNPPLGQLLVAAPLVALHRAYRFPADTDLALCRLPVLACGAGLLMLLWRWGRALGGRWVGLAALAGASLEPNLLAHAHLATLDLPLACLWWGALWAWREAERCEARPLSRPALLFALLFATATLTKFTGFFLLPAAVLAGIATQPHGPAVRRRAGIALVALVVFGLAAYVAYGFGPLRHGVPERLLAGILGKFAHREEVHFAYLAGRRSASGFLAYYLVAMLVKTPLPLLALAALGGVVLWRRGARRELALLVVPALVVVVAFTAIRVNVGVRHVLPAYPALVLLSAVGASALASRGARGRIMLALLALAWIGGVARVAPEWLAYFNVIGGGPAGGHRWLLDSNLDWGQDDGRLAGFLHEASLRRETWEIDPDAEVPRPGRLVVNANALHNLQRRSDRPYAWLRDLPPVGFAGWAWRRYDVHESDFERQAARRPASASAQAAYAEVLATRGERAAAAAVLEAAARRLAGTAEFLELTAFAAEGAARRSDWAESAGWARRGLAVRPDSPRLQGLAHLAVLENAAAGSDSESAARAQLELGMLRVRIGPVEAALPLLRGAAGVLRNDPRAQRAYAIAQAQLGNYSEAVRILEGDGQSGRFPGELGLFRTMEEVGAALARGDDAIDPDALREFGRAAFETGRADTAAGAFAQALRQNPDDGLSLAYLCEIQVRSKMRLVAERIAPRTIEPDRSGAGRGREMRR